MTETNTAAPVPATPWRLVKAGPDGVPAVDVVLDANGNQLYAAFEGIGILASLAPHRLKDPRVVSAGDLSVRAAAPGALLSVLGRKINTAQAGNVPTPVWAASTTESQIQVPFDATGSTLSLSMDSAAGPVSIGLPLREVSPSVFVDRDGSPLVLNGDTGLVLDAGSPAKSGARLQIFATGLGKVTPEWRAGMAAPMDVPPTVVAPVQVMLDREPVEVTRAILAPGYVGFYLVEIQLPKIVNSGPAELYIDAGGQQSNRVRIFLEP
jgi:uncharacterized protein (TIGR03437 family)